MNRSPESVDSTTFREAMSRLAAGVSIVTTADERAHPFAMTATAVCSVSLEPPMVLASLAVTSATHDAVLAGERFAVNFLGRGGEALADRFAASRPDKFDGVDWRPGVTGCPVLPEALAVCECVLEQAVPAGDHTVFIGLVVRADVADEVPNDPLIHFRGAFGALSRGGSR